MRKVLFLMFLLLLMGLGAAGVKAQVRIGGNGAPNTAAVLDLNATDLTNTGTQGLALPRVSLTDVSTPLTGTPVVNGMMVYNTSSSTTGGRGIGIYYWVVDSSKWMKVDDGSFVAANVIDSTSIKNGGIAPSDLSSMGAVNGQTIGFNGTSWVPENLLISSVNVMSLPSTWPVRTDKTIPAPSLLPGRSGICIYHYGTDFYPGVGIANKNNTITLMGNQESLNAGTIIEIDCVQ